VRNKTISKEKLKRLNQKQRILGGCILLLLLVGLGYFGVFRPVIVMDNDRAGVYVRNKGGMDALIFKVDGFWYWGGKVALLANMPGIHQRVEPGPAPSRLQIPDIPVPGKQATQPGPCYMKLAVRYTIPGIPIFRYATPFYFEYDPNRKIWAATKSIPPRHRSLGNLAIGNIGEIELDFD
jgi:hypothetical protein